MTAENSSLLITRLPEHETHLIQAERIPGQQNSISNQSFYTPVWTLFHVLPLQEWFPGVITLLQLHGLFTVQNGLRYVRLEVITQEIALT